MTGVGVVLAPNLGGRPCGIVEEIVALWKTKTRSEAPGKPASQATDERRRRHRVEQYFECSWQSEWSAESCRVSSLSPTGCYIEGRFTVPPIGSMVQEIIITLPTGPITLQGEVVHAIPGVGFAVRFADVDADAQSRLTALAQHHSR